MTKTYEHAIYVFMKRHSKIVNTNQHRNHKEIFTIFYNEFKKLYEYINEDYITYIKEDELNYLKVRYLIEKYTYYYEKGPSYIDKWRLIFIYVQIITLVIRQQKRQNKRRKY